MSLRATLLAAFLPISFSALAQTNGDVVTDNDRSKTVSVSKPSRDFVMLQFVHDRWRFQDDAAADTINGGGINRGFNAYLCYDFPIKKAPMSFAAGIGIGTANYYFDNQEVLFTEAGQSQVRFVDERLEYKRFKLTTTYLEAPFELRYFGNPQNRNRGFKAAVGFRAGTLLAAHTKGVREFEGAKVVDKESTKRYFEQWRFSATLRLGWGNFSLLGTYNLNNQFQEGLGPAVTPYSVGICITGL